jgi:ATP-binding cassette subfamily C protein CydC
MRALLPYLALYKRHKWMLTLGIVLAIVTLLASIGLLTLSGWFLSASAVAGVAGLYSFNYMLPAAGRSRYRHYPYCRTLFRAAGQPRRHFPRAAAPAYLHLQQTAAPLPAGLARFRQGELLNRVVADVDTLDHLYLRVISPIVGAFVVIVVVTLGLSVLDVPVALTLGGIMLLTLILLPPLFYRAGKSTGKT